MSSSPSRASSRTLGADPRERAGRLAALLLLVSAVTVVGTVGLLPPGGGTGPALAVAALAALTGLACWPVPWARLPREASLAPVAVVLLLLGGGLGAWAGSLSHYAPLYALAALHVGLTHPPRTSLRLAPLVLGSAAVALLGREPATSAVDVVGAAVLAVVVGEVLSRVLDRSQTATRGAEALLSAVTTLHEAGTEAAATDATVGIAQDLLQCDVAVLLLAASAGSPHWSDRGSRGLPGPSGTLVLDVRVESGLSVAAAEGRALFVADAAGSPLVPRALAEELGLASVLLVPVPGEGSWGGCLVAGWRSSRDGLDRFAEQVVALLSHQSGALLDRLRSVGRLEQQARTDALTGLANRRVFLDALDRLRPGGAVVFLDLDHFKRLNDTQGHAAGDAVLVAFAAALRASVRDDDCAARYGGEEFALVLPSAASVDMTGAAQVVVDRLRARWDGPVTFSVGIAAHRLGDAPSTTLARADAAVYAAKAAGRDTTVLAGPADLVPAQREGRAVRPGEAVRPG